MNYFHFLMSKLTFKKINLTKIYGNGYHSHHRAVSVVFGACPIFAAFAAVFVYLYRGSHIVTYIKVLFGRYKFKIFCEVRKVLHNSSIVFSHKNPSAVQRQSPVLLDQLF